MKHYVSLLIGIAFLLPAVICAQGATTKEEATGTLTVKIVGLRSDKGEVRLALCNSEENYTSEEQESFRRIAVPIADKQAEAVFEELPFGEYAAKLFHDENSNGDLDTNFLGIPKEDYAFSNNAKGTFGPAKYEKARFEFKEQMSIEIRIASKEE